MIHLITYEYNGAAISFADDAFVNLTELCSAFKRRPNDFLSLKSTQDYIAVLAADTGLPVKSEPGNPRITPTNEASKSRFTRLGGNPDIDREALILTVVGGDTRSKTATGIPGSGPDSQGTWAHPDLALECARWLSPAFGLWCNRKIRELLSGRIVSIADNKPVLKRLEVGIADTRELLHSKVARFWQVQAIPGQYPFRVYLDAAGLSQDCVAPLALYSAMRERRANYEFPTGYCRVRRTTGVGMARMRKSGSQKVRTWPPEQIAAALRVLGHEFREPDAAALAASEEKFMYIADVRRRRALPVPRDSARGQTLLDIGHGSEIQT